MEDEITLCNPILKKRIIKCISKDNKCYIFMGSNSIVRKLLITLKSNIKKSPHSSQASLVP